MKELVVISGKGGTGKTSIVATFAKLAESVVLADCDVDASNLHVLLEPTIHKREEFWAGKMANIRTSECLRCGTCMEHCRFGAVRMKVETVDNVTYCIDPHSCEGCGVCVQFCPAEAIDFTDKLSGEWFISETHCGPMVHARLGIAEGNSGKLVSLVREQARYIAEQEKADYVIVDGPPGVGCPVIASITGASLVLAITEPTLSGLHDLERVAQLTQHFQIPLLICINKCDINPKMSQNIEDTFTSRKIRIVGKIPYDTGVINTQLQKQTMLECSGNKVADAVRLVWRETRAVLESVTATSNETSPVQSDFDTGTHALHVSAMQPEQGTNSPGCGVERNCHFLQQGYQE
jgi:MinD superfamily P-loop ATPase